MKDDPLLQPYQLKHLTLRNRILSTAHEPAYTEDGMPKEKYRLYHSEKARGGIAMTMIGGSAVVSPDSPPGFGNIMLYRDEVVRWMSELADDVHSHGAAVMIQITHLGRRNNWNKADWLPPLAPSHIKEGTHRAFPKAMEDWDMDRVVADYADAAERVKASGFDGLEVECYGHLIDQFWSPATNTRDDEYGGSLENRMRFGMRVFQAIRDRVGPDFLIGSRLTCDEAFEGGIDEKQGHEIAMRLAQSGLFDFFNVIRGHVDTHEGVSHVIPAMGYRSSPHLDFSAGIREATGMPTFHACRVQDVATARHAIQSDKLDMVGMTRAHLADPHIVNKIASGHEDQIRPCVAMGYCIDAIYAGQAVCIHNAATGRERHVPHVIPKGDTAKKVVVIGAGPGGLEAARVAAERGHQVVVLEASAQAGGQVRLISALQRRKEVMGIVDWRLGECERLGVTFRYNCYAEMADVTVENPDIVIVATGGIPSADFLASGAELATSSWDILSGEVAPASEVLLFDDHGAHPGMTAAEYIIGKDSQLRYVTPERTIAPDVGGTNYPAYLKAFSKADVSVKLNLRLRAIEKKGNRLVGQFFDEYAKLTKTIEADQIVVEHGAVPLDDLYFALKPLSTNLGETDQAALIDFAPQTLNTNPQGQFQLFRIGDAVASRNVHAAVLDAVRLLIGS